ncbi:MAG: nitroreductase family protein [Planctomycetota bacterium]
MHEPDDPVERAAGDGAARAAGPSESDTVLALMSRHRSVRSFTPDPVDDSTVERALRAAQCAATSSWVQAYHLLQVTDPAERGAIADLAGGQPQITEAGAFFVVCADERRHRLVAARAKAPHVPCPESFVIALVDASLFAQNLCLAFEAQGLGTCYIGGIRNDLPRLDGILELPEGVLPLFGLCVGTPAADPGTRPRLPVRAVWSKQRYPQDDTMLEAIDEHDADASAYYGLRGKPTRNWSGGVLRKYAIDPRPNVGPYYASKGARLSGEDGAAESGGAP